MIIEIDDDYKYIVMVAILKDEKQFIVESLKEGNHFHEQDRLDDEEYLQAINVLLKNYEVQDGGP